jgi:light-regulated signal transduction histidine kinase (bacteriophytochrome)
MAQLFQNLISNAIKFRGVKSPHISISARSGDDKWFFSVRDNGIGITPEYYNRIFGIFQRLHTKDEYPGSGIGLAICKKIIEQHNGRIWVESQPGKGTTFYFTIPKRRES